MFKCWQCDLFHTTGPFSVMTQDASPQSASEWFIHYCSFIPFKDNPGRTIPLHQRFAFPLMTSKRQYRSCDVCYASNCHYFPYLQTFFVIFRHFHVDFLSFCVGSEQGVSLLPISESYFFKFWYIPVSTWFLILRYLWWVLHGFLLLPHHCYGCFFFLFVLSFLQEFNK